MKRFDVPFGACLALCATFLLASAAHAADNDSPRASVHALPGVGQVRVIAEDHHDTLPSLRDAVPPATGYGVRTHFEGELPLPPGADNQIDAAIQHSATAAPTRQTPTVISNVDGVGNGFTGPQGTYSVNAAPPDTVGAVGTTQYVQVVNSGLAVFSKTTKAVVYGPVPTSTLWSGFGGGCQTNNDGDAVVVFDKLANRWVVSQFSVSTTPYLECVAVSQTADATGAWNRYAFNYGNTNFPDYPKMGVWPDAYYTTFNVFANGSTFAGSNLCAYDRVSMLAGSAATQQCVQLSTSFGGVLPADLDGTNPPPANTPNYLINFGTNKLNLWKFHVDWANTANTSLTGPTAITVASFTAACSGGTCIPQKGTTQQLDSLADRLMFRLAYRNLSGTESLLVSHSVRVSATQTGVRWYEIRTPNGTPTVYQQSTYSPDTTLYRWMPSIAMDQQGNILLGYSTASSSAFPSIAYTGRAFNDTLSTMQAEQVMQAGAGSQTGSSLSRWGDYSAMTVDPVDDCTFWYTTEYLKANGAFNWSTSIGSMKFATCGVVTHTVTPSVTGSGTISPNTAQSVTAGSTTQFTLTPNANNHIVNVTGTCGGSLSGNTFTTNAITADCTVIANFAIDQHTVTPSVTGNGAISPSTAQSINHGSTTQFTLTPNANNHIVSVTGTCGGSLSGSTYTTNAITADCTVIANFALDQHTVTPSVTGNGSISPSTAQSINHGSTTQFTVTPNANNHIVSVTGTCGGSLSGNTFTTNAITADCTVIANFALDQHTVTPSVTGNGSISPSTAQSINHGSTTQFTLTPNANNHIVSVTGTCGGSLSGSTYTTNAITADCTVIANFALDQHTVTPSVTGGGAISPSTAQSINHGSTTQFTLTPNANNHIVSVTGTCGGSLSGSTYTTNAITADCTVIANFALDQHTVTPSVSGNGAISPSTAQSIDHGSTTQFTLSPNANNHIASVSGTCGGSLSGNTYTTNAITADCTVIANFALDQHTVTPSAGLGGSISPNTPQSIDHGATMQFTLTPAAQEHIASVTGTCGGSLSGNTYTTNAITADCTVAANFAPNVLVFTTPPANVPRGAALGTIAVSEQDGSGNPVADTATVDFAITVCGAPLDLGSVAMVNGVATLNSAQVFRTLASARQIDATATGLNGVSAQFDVVASPDWIFDDGYESCRP